MFKSFDLRSDIGQRENTLFENVYINSNSFTDDAYVRKYNNASYYHISNSLTGYLGYFQTIYDQTPISLASTNALADITYGMSTGSTWYSSTVVQRDEKANVYKIFASTLLGSTTKQFSWAGTEYTDLFFISLKRNVFKDYFRSKYLTMWLSASAEGPVSTLTASDSCGSTIAKEYAGDYGPIYSCSNGNVVGLAFYNAGVIAITTASLYGPYFSGSWHMNDLLTGSTIDCVVDGARNHIQQLNVHPATRINSTAYKCILLDKDFNYSSNPTYTDTNGLIRVMSGSLSLTNVQSRTYITTIGLCDDLNNLLAVAKVSTPILKSPEVSLIFTVRVDY
ncbi:MAG: hypothetical protein WC438_05585 [Candidatus Pacearchaeota archaeon]